MTRMKTYLAKIFGWMRLHTMALAVLLLLAAILPPVQVQGQISPCCAILSAASYDVEGQMTSETYPNAMTANYTHNATGEVTGIEYDKTTHCKEKCPEIGRASC